MHPAIQGNQLQSLAEARILSGQTTQLHKHLKSEELYYITSGTGRMRLGGDTFNVEAGDCICIPPGTEHNICNTSQDDLIILCCCAPAYSHQDTILL